MRRTLAGAQGFGLWAALQLAAVLCACTAPGSSVGSDKDPTTPDSQELDAARPAVLAPASTPSAPPTAPSSPLPVQPTSTPEPNSDPPLLRAGIEVMLRINGRQVHALQRWGDWLYFTGGIDELATHRVPKDTLNLYEGADVLTPWSGSTVPEIYHADATHIYWLDNDVIYRQGLDDVIESLELGERFYVLSGDQDSVFAVGEGCARIALVDKAR